MTLLIFFITLSIGVSFLCSVLEAVILSVTPSYLAALQTKKPKLYNRVNHLKADIEKPLASILPLQTKPLIGNDLVDLKEARPQAKESNPRFLERVFTAQERALIKHAPDPALMLWKLWAAKEAGYKLLKRLDQDLLFAHKQFKVQPLGSKAGLLQHQVMRLAINWDVTDTYIHCLATPAEPKPNFANVFYDVTFTEDPCLDNEELTPDELHSTYSLASRNVRKLAKKLFYEKIDKEIEVIRFKQSPGFAPPVIVGPSGFIDPEYNISLSHDGDYIASAVCGPVISTF